MSKTKSKTYVKGVVTPICEIWFPKLTEPDDLSHKYQVCGVFANADIEALRADVERWLVDYGKTTGIKNIQESPLKAWMDEDKKPVKGMTRIDFKNEHAVHAVDTLGNPVHLDKIINGAKGAISYDAYAWGFSGKMGVTFKLKGLVITDLAARPMPMTLEEMGATQLKGKGSYDALQDGTGGEPGEAVPF